MAESHSVEVEWRLVPSHPGYEASSEGQIRRLATGCVLTSTVDRAARGYLKVKVLLTRGKGRAVDTHRLVAEAFLGSCPAGHQVDHIDGDRTNPKASNLEYVTPAENLRRARVRRGLWGFAAWGSRTHCPKGHPYDDANTRINTNGVRSCRTCSRLRDRGTWQRNNPEKAKAAKKRWLEKRKGEPIEAMLARKGSR